uniref:Synergin gamma C-terminal domain-containing protein n=2 Tax=Amphimedon queenslandica TaxID=400682 RepID=A0A1X7TED7_AMPQE
DLWSAVNLTSPGQLTQTELYQLLGLIGLAQNRQNVKVTLHDLLMTPSPPVPTLKAINIINTSNEDDFCEFKASPLVPHKFDGVGSVGVTSTPPTTQPASDPLDPYSALRVLAPPTNNDPGTQELLTINKEPQQQQQQNQQQIDQQRHHDQQHQILHQQQQQLPVINTDVQPSTGDGWADFTSFPDTSQPLTTPSTDTTASSNIINMTSPTPVAVVGGGPVAGGVAPAGASDGLIWSDDEFTEFSTYQSQDVSVAEPVLSSPSHTIGRGGGGGGGGGGGIVSPSPTSPMSSTSTDSNKSIGLSEIWCQCLQKCLDLLKDSQSLLTSSSNDEETLNIIINEREGQMKIKGLAELYRFAKRLHTSSRGQGKSLMSHSKSETLTELMLNIKKKWNEICELFDQEKIDKILNTSSNSFFAGATPKEGGGGDKERCILCLQPSHIFISPLVTIDGCSEDYQLATGFVSGRLFHVQCANFYKNCLSLDFEQIP